MKKFFKSILFSASIALFMTSCQNEDTQVTTNGNANLTSTSVLTGLLARVSQDSTSVDNVIDSTSCFSVNLPVTVVVNNQQLIIVDATGYAAVQNILTEFSDDDDEVSFVFPISITFANYTTTVVTSNSQLDDIIDNCGDVTDEVEIECLSINYPITISYYNATNQTPLTITITSDSELYNFFENFDDDDYATINYPISVTNSNAVQVVINSNTELETAIEAAENSCNNDSDDDIDDDDDNDSDNTPISPNFISILQSGEWHVSYFFDNTNVTTNYTGYNFSFENNGIVGVSVSSINLSGTWESYVDDNENTLEINFLSSQLVNLSDDWEIIAYTETEIRLKDVSGGNGETDYLTFTKN
jgi:hypothetical protein